MFACPSVAFQGIFSAVIKYSRDLTFLWNFPLINEHLFHTLYIYCTKVSWFHLNICNSIFSQIFSLLLDGYLLVIYYDFKLKFYRNKYSVQFPRVGLSINLFEVLKCFIRFCQICFHTLSIFQNKNFEAIFFFHLHIETSPRLL